MSAKTDNKGLDALYQFIGTFNQDVLGLAEKTFTDLQPKHLADFQQQPPVRSWPTDYPNNRLPFDTEEQRRWYWANIGKPYTRSGRMAQNLKQEIQRDGKSVSVVASYPSPSTKYVLGNILGEHVRTYQQRFHAATGWQLAAPKLETHGQSYYDNLVENYNKHVEKTFK